MYIEKKGVPYDSLKAIAWFSQAAAADFVQSQVIQNFYCQFNIAQLFINGSEDNKVKINLTAALTYLEKI